MPQSNITINRPPLPLLPDCGCREGLCPPGVNLFGKAGHFAGGGFFVKNPFFCRIIDNGLGHIEPFDGIVHIPRHGEAHILDNVFHPGLNRFVPQAPTFVLAGALQC
jgi:hypothetical protein